MPAEGRKLTKNEKKRLKEKAKKAAKASSDDASGISTKKLVLDVKNDNIELQFNSSMNDPKIDSVVQDENLKDEFKAIFEKFNRPRIEQEEMNEAAEIEEGNGDESDGYSDMEGMEEDEDDEDGSTKKLSKRKAKLLNRMTVGQLKLLVDRPELIEAHDVAAPDPLFLAHMKGIRNSVPVPKHWSQKRKYLAGGRGREKIVYQLPDFIAETGISKIRDSLQEIEDKKAMKAQARNRTRPTMGKIDIDYQVLHDAFFKYQSKPKMTRHGDIYYESKEYQTAKPDKKPGGHLSDALLQALGMKDNKTPPPWLITQQRYGPPPSYPNLRIPGLTCPIPIGGQFGYHQGGWGKPPVDEYGRPIYGDVFAQAVAIDEGQELIDQTLWGEFIPQDELEQEYVSSDEDEDEDEDGEGMDGIQGMGDASSGNKVQVSEAHIMNVQSDAYDSMLSAETIDLRKRAAGTAGGAVDAKEKQLYTVLNEAVPSEDTGEGFFTTNKTYDTTAVVGQLNSDASTGNDNEEGAVVLNKEKGAEGAQAEKKRKLAQAGSAKNKLKDFKF